MEAPRGCFMPVIGKKTLKEIRQHLVHAEAHETLIDAVDAALKTKKFVKAARAPRRAKQEKKREAWKSIRAEVLERAGGACECGCGRSFEEYHVEVDHMFGGSGRRVSLQSVYTCWALTSLCHLRKTRNTFGAGEFLRAFARHCERRWIIAGTDHTTANGYRHAASIASARLASLEMLPRGQK